MPEQAPELSALLRALLDAGVDFVLVGGAAAVIQGAPITTQDIDIVHARSEANVSRLLAVLADLDASVRDLAGRSLPPSADALLGTGQSLLVTRLGRLDALGTLHDGRGYAELLGHTDVVDLSGLKLRVLDLPTLIEIKASTGRAKDRLVVPVLLALARQRDNEADGDD
jgi:predicted nucleotidyltransferase